MARILVIDDSAVQRIFAKSALEADGHQVVEAKGGEEGLTLARGQAFDCVLLDWLMPDTSGRDVLQAIHDDKLAQRVIVVTGGPDEAVREESLRLGAAAVVDKPREAAELRDAVKIVIQREV